MMTKEEMWLEKQGELSQEWLREESQEAGGWTEQEWAENEVVFALGQVVQAYKRYGLHNPFSRWPRMKPLPAEVRCLVDRLCGLQERYDAMYPFDDEDDEAA